MALAWLMEKGTSASALASVAALRDANSFADPRHDVSESIKWILKGEWKTNGWGHERAARAAAASLVLANNGFSGLALLHLTEIKGLIARGWCQWTSIEDGSDFAAAESNFWLGSVHVKNPASDWGVPIPSLVMPRFAVERLRQGFGSEGFLASCIASGEALLDSRYGTGLARYLEPVS